MKTATVMLPPPDVNLHSTLADADVDRRVRTLRLIAASACGSSRGRLAAAELRMIEVQRKGRVDAA